MAYENNQRSYENGSMYKIYGENTKTEILGLRKLGLEN